MQLVDTHCHIHDSEFQKRYPDETADELIEDAKKASVNTLICVGTDLRSSKEAVEFCKSRSICYPSIALHPHEAEQYSSEELDQQIQDLHNLLEEDNAVIAIGETGLDYFYHESDEVFEKQKKTLKNHITMALNHNLPLIFHIRNPKEHNNDGIGKAFKDFFDIIDKYDGISGVVHSFSASEIELTEVAKRGLYVGLNGIITFTKDENQLKAVKNAPIDKIVLETDAPFLTPAPYRGKVCKPEHTRVTAEFISELRGEDLEEFAKATTENANRLFKL